MRPDDLAWLNEPFPEHVELTDTDARSAIGVNLPNQTALEDEIFADLSELPLYGLAGGLPSRARAAAS
jgi:hypothetical protein